MGKKPATNAEIPRQARDDPVQQLVNIAGAAGHCLLRSIMC